MDKLAEITNCGVEFLISTPRKVTQYNTAAGVSSDNQSVNNMILSGSPTHDTNAPVDGKPILENIFRFYSITLLRADTTANPEELAITDNNPFSAWIKTG